MAEQNECPNRGEWTQLLHATLTPDRQKHLEQHLDKCPICRQQLDELAGGLPLDIDQAIATTGSLMDNLVNRVVANGAKANARDGHLSPEIALPPDLLEPSNRKGAIGRIGQFDVLSIVGRGGLGVVLRALDPKLNRVVAIKIPAPELVANPLARKRFQREAQSAAAVSHEHVVRTYAVDEVRNVPFLVMEYIDGGSLQQELDRRGPFDVRDVVRIGMQLAQGLAAAHKQGLVHRDIKPANVLLDGGIERVKLTDFGLARAVDDATITHSGAVAGTPQYMSPEQARGETVDSRSDLFSLGSVLYTLCAGRPAFRSETPLAVLKRICDDEPRPLRQCNPDIPDFLLEIIETLMKKDPNDRYATAEEVASALESWLAYLQQPRGTPRPLITSKPQVETPAPQKVKAKRRSSAAVWIFLLGCLPICGLVLLMFAAIAVPTFVARDSPSQFSHIANYPTEITVVGFREVEKRRARLSLRSRSRDTEKVENIPMKAGGPISNKVQIHQWSSSNDWLKISCSVEQGEYEFELIDPTSGTIFDRTISIIDHQGKNSFTIGMVLEDGKWVGINDPRHLASKVRQVPTCPRSVTFTPDGKGLLVTTSGAVSRLPLVDADELEAQLKRKWDRGNGGDRPIDMASQLEEKGRSSANSGTHLGLGAVEEFVHTNGDCTRIAFQKGNDFLLAGAPDGFDLRSYRDPQRIQRFSGTKGIINRFSLSAHSPRFASAGKGQGVFVWDATKGVISIIPTQDQEVFGVGISPDGNTVITSGETQKLAIWDVKSLKLIQEKQSLVEPTPEMPNLVPTSVSTAIHYLQDGSRVMMAGADFRVHIFAMPECTWETSLNGHTGVIEAMAVNEEHGIIVTGSSDLTARVWDLKSNELRGVLRGHSDRVLDVAISPDGRWIATVGADLSVRLWATPQAEEGR